MVSESSVMKICPPPAITTKARDTGNSISTVDEKKSLIEDSLCFQCGHQMQLSKHVRLCPHCGRLVLIIRGVV